MLIRGQSGSGKSTIMRAVSGVWPWGKGEIRLPRGNIAFMPQKPYFPLVEGIVEHGNLSERIAAALEPHVDDEDAFTDAARRVYIELSDALTENKPWKGRG